MSGLGHAGVVKGAHCVMFADLKAVDCAEPLIVGFSTLISGTKFSHA